MSASADATNGLLAALAGADLRGWLQQLEQVEVPLGQILYEPGGILSHVLPDDCHCLAPQRDEQHDLFCVRRRW